MRRMHNGRVLTAIVPIMAALIAAGMPGRVLAAADFQLIVTPSDATLKPGGSTVFTVSLGSVGGFNEPITLSVSGIPPGAGVSASFSVNDITPPGLSDLTLTAAADATLGPFDLVITATGGGITHEARRGIRVDFVLSPICYGTIRGQVTDELSGAAISDATVFVGPGVLTDEQGFYTAKVALPEGNIPYAALVYVQKTGYWDGRNQGQETVRCELTTIIDVQLLKYVPAQVTGRVVEGEVDPADSAIVRPKVPATPIEGAGVFVGAAGSAISGADGDYKIDLPYVGFRNSTLESAHLAAALDGYWPRGGNWPLPLPIGDIAPGDTKHVDDMALVKKCTGELTGTVVFGDTGDPVAGVTVGALQTDGLQFLQATTDGGGHFTIPSAFLAYNNTPVTFNVSAAARSLDDPKSQLYGADTKEAHLDACGDSADVKLVLPVIPLGSVVGRITDIETGDPIVDAFVQPENGCGPCVSDFKTDADGRFSFTKVPTSSEPAGTPYVFQAGHDSYYPVSTDAVVHPGETTTLNITMLRRQFGQIEGVVTDSVTGLPIEGAGSTFATTDADGHYLSGPLGLNYPNSPTDYGVQFAASGYWPENGIVTVEANKTKTLDAALLPICTDATINGTVINGETLDPIEGASVAADTGSLTYTDASGHFVLRHVQVGDHNAPIDVFLTASALGFHSQSKRVTVFCGASLTIEFGPEPPKAVIEGYVTNRDTDVPMAGVFIGSEFGTDTTTDAIGHYEFDNAPLNLDGSPRTWEITAAPDGFTAKTDPVTAVANERARLDFEFGLVNPDTGSLKISKTFNDGGSAFSGTFTIQYDCGTGLAGDVTVAAAASVSVGDIPTGSSCVVSEPTLPTAPTGYTWATPVVTGSPAAIGTPGATVEVTVANSLTPDTGSLKISKTLSNPDGATGLPATYAINYDCGNGSSGIVSIAAGGNTTISNIPTGASCSVNEPATSNPAVSNFAWGTPVISGSPAQITSGNTQSVTVANSITRSRGSLQILKSVAGATTGFSAMFTFAITCTGPVGTYSASITYPSTTSATLSALPTGSICTVQETLPAPPRGQTWGAPTYSPPNGQVTIGNGTAVTVAVRNFLTLKTGALTIGFWQNKNGQGIISGGASTSGICNSGTWLFHFVPFEDLPHNATPSPTATCGQVATYVYNVVKAANASGAAMNAMLKAQMLATSLDVYFSDPALGGNKIGAPVPIAEVTIDLTKVCKIADGSNGTGKCSGVYSNVSAAFGGATNITVQQMLNYAASQSNTGGSTWYANAKATQELAKNGFDAINNSVMFGP